MQYRRIFLLKSWRPTSTVRKYPPRRYSFELSKAEVIWDLGKTAVKDKGLERSWAVQRLAFTWLAKIFFCCFNLRFYFCSRVFPNWSNLLIEFYLFIYYILISIPSLSPFPLPFFSEMPPPIFPFLVTSLW